MSIEELKHGSEFGRHVRFEDISGVWFLLKIVSERLRFEESGFQ
jgi:hypothetical protein